MGSAGALDAFTTEIGGSYAIERELEGAGMSHVFVAMDPELERRVVIKALRADILEGVSRERFRREVLVSATLQHPHIVGVIDAGEAAGIPYFVMPFVEGESLRAVLKREGRLPLPQAVAILRDVARALAFAHAKGIVHRDIKPDNILLAGGSAAVADFGVAKALQVARADARHPHGTLTGVGMALGTPAYMAPEQASGDPATDHRADLYALGAMAYEMVTGQPPFVRPSVTETLQAHLVAPPPTMSDVRPGVPFAFEQLVARCLAKDARARPRDAEEILEALADPAVISGEVRSARVEAFAATRRRRRLVVALAAAVLVAGAGYTWWTTTRPAPATVAQPEVTLVPGTLAVFPLTGITADSVEASVLSQGMTAALTNAFAGLPGLRVVSSSAVTRALGDSLG
ncbi:MAG: serine/threonine protein kinase, partial [Gemmatimonadetes bacterium]|nr:serine/threonine protein kinase [Gemmatimonadota bacterium]